MMSNEELWKAVLGEMELSLSRANFITWFKNTSVISKDKVAVTVSVPNGFIKEWLENKFNKKILQSIRNLSPEIREVKYSIGKPKPELIKQDISKIILDKEFEATSEAPLDADIDKNTNLNRKYSFDSFVIGSNNELAHAAFLAVTKSLGKLYNPLFLYGGVGLGKTHLLQAVGNKITEIKERRVLYIPAERFTANIIEAIRNKNIEDLKSHYARLDLLIIDDIQFIAGKEKTQDIIFSTFNELYGRNKQIVLSSDRPPQAIPALEERLRSRFEGGMIADVSEPDFETRLAILKQKIHEKNYVNFDEETLTYIATHIQKNVRELEGALNRVGAFSQIYNRTPDMKEVKNILNAYLSSPYRKTSPQSILKAVSNFYDISL